MFLAVFQLKSVFFIHSVNLLMVPAETFSADSIKYLRKAASGTSGYYCLYLLLYLLIITVCLRLIVKTAPADIYCLAGCRNS